MYIEFVTVRTNTNWKQLNQWCTLMYTLKSNKKNEKDKVWKK